VRRHIKTAYGSTVFESCIREFGDTGEHPNVQRSAKMEQGDVRESLGR
jgi:hypothetical protein